MRMLLIGLACLPVLVTAAVEVSPAAAGRTAVETGALHALIGVDGRLLELSPPGRPNLLAQVGGWNPGLSVTLGPPGDDTTKPAAIEEWMARAEPPVVQGRADGTTEIQVTQGFAPWLRVNKIFTFAAGKPWVRLRWEAELMQPAWVRRFGVIWVTAADADTLLSPGPSGAATALAEAAPGTYFRTPAADGSLGFPDFRRDRWLAAAVRPRAEGIAVLFPDLEAWAGFRGQHNLASRLTAGGFVLEFANPRANGLDQGSPGYLEHPAGTRLVADLALTVWAGDVATVARAALTDCGASLAPAATFPVQALAFPTALTASASGGVPTFHLLSGAALAPAFGFVGDRGQAQELVLLLDLPEGVQLADATWLHPDLGRPSLAEPLPVQHDGLGFRRYRIPVPTRAVGQSAPPWATVFAPFLQPEPGFVGGDLVYHLEGKAGRGLEARVRLASLPPLPPVRLPQAFDLMPWYEYTLEAATPALRGNLLATLEAVGVRGTQLPTRDRTLELARELKARGWRLRLGMGWSSAGPYGFQLHNYGRIDWAARGYPEEVWLLDRDGKRWVGVFCSGYVSDRGPLFLQEYRTWLQGLLTPEVRELCWAISNDYEVGGSGPMDATRSCFCSRCLAQLASHGGPALAADVTPEVILAQYRPAWTRFRMWQNAEIIRLHSELVRDLAPGLVNSICAHWVPDPPGSEVFDGEAVDVRQFDAVADQHTPMMYHGGARFVDNVVRTCRTLTKPTLVLTAAFYDAWSAESVVFSPAEVRQNLLAIAAAGGSGGGFYASFDHLDGAYLHAIQAAMAEIARAESWFRHGTHDDTAVRAEGLPDRERLYRQDGRERLTRDPDWAPHLRHLAWRQADSLLAVVFNLHPSRAAAVRLSVATAPPGAGLTVEDLSTGHCLARGSARAWGASELASGLGLSIPPLGTRFILVRAARAEDAVAPADDAQAVLDDWQRRFRREEVREENVTAAGIRILAGTDADAGGLVIQTPTQELVLAPDLGGRIRRWNAGGVTFVAPTGAKGDGAAVDLVWAPEKARWSGDEDAACEVRSRGLREGAAEVVLEREWAGSPLLGGLRLRKTFRIAADRPEIRLQIDLENRGEAERTVAFWMHHVLQPGREALQRSGHGALFGCPLLVPWVDGVREVRGPGGDSVFTVSAAGDLPDGAASALRQRAVGALVGNRIAVLGPEAGVVLTFVRDQVSQVYSWRGEPPTTEWMYTPARLAPGASWTTTVSLLALPGAAPAEVARVLREEQKP
jgi:hypothetical protein